MREPAADLTDVDRFSVETLQDVIYVLKCTLSQDELNQRCKFKEVEPGCEGLILKTNRNKLACPLIYLKHPN